MKIVVFYDVSYLGTFLVLTSTLFCTEDRSSVLLRNIGTYLPNWTA